MKSCLTLSLCFSFVLAACALTQAQGERKKNTTLHPAWQDVLKNKLASEKKYNEAWGMFSQSAMEDRGQVMIFLEHGKDYGWLDYVKRNETEISQELKVNGKQWKDFRAAVLKDDLKDFSKSFDGVRYEYLHVVKEKGVIKEKKRILMMNPSSSPAAQQHAALVNSFYKLVEK